MSSSGDPLDYQTSMVDGDVAYRQQYRRCGKQSCSRCAPGQSGHGPYWYAYWWEGGRRRVRYVGKELPPSAHTVGKSVVQSASDDLHVRTLGRFEVRRGHITLSLASRRAASLFKCLLGASEHRLARDEAMELLWPEADLDHAATNLRTTLYLLRRVLDVPGSATHVLTDGEIIRLTPSPSGVPLTGWLDVETFERLAEAALATRDAAGCRAALDHYTGEYLPDDAYEVWAEPLRERMRRLQVNLHLHLAMLTGAEGRVEEAERSLRTVLAGDQGHEGAAAILMSLLASSGRDLEALRVYHELSTALDEDLGVAPSAEIEELRARIVAKRANPAPEQRSNLGRGTNLPAQLTSFVGREWELTEATRLMERSRLVTLTGAGGCGKTRLAMEAAGGWLDRYPQGVWLVELAGLGDPDLVPEVVAATLGIEHEVSTSTIDTLCSRWHRSRMLLVLDNCEHLIETCAALASTLLAQCPELHILATSREVLGVAGEIPYRVPSLATPDPEQEIHAEQVTGYEAVVLFTDRAQSQSRAFSITEANAAAVVRSPGRPAARH